MNTSALVTDNGVTYLTLTSSGISGEAWYNLLQPRIERHWRHDPADPKGRHMPERLHSILTNPGFVPGQPGQVYKVAIIKATDPAIDLDDSMPRASRADGEAQRRGWTKPPMEVACLLRLTVTNEMIRSMGLSQIVVMHDPVEFEVHYPGQRWCLAINLYDKRCGGVPSAEPDDGFHAEGMGQNDMTFTLGHGFAYLVP